MKLFYSYCYSRYAGLISIHSFPLSLLFYNHRSLPVPICGYQLQTLLTLPWLSWLPYTSFLHPLALPPFCLLPPPPSSFSPLLYMAITCPYSCYIGLHCTTCTYTGRPGEPLTLSKAASNHVDVRPTSQCRAVSPAALVSAAALDCCWRWRFSQFFARWHIHISPP